MPFRTVLTVMAQNLLFLQKMGPDAESQNNGKNPLQ